MSKPVSPTLEFDQDSLRVLGLGGDRNWRVAGGSDDTVILTNSSELRGVLAGGPEALRVFLLGLVQTGFNGAARIRGRVGRVLYFVNGQLVFASSEALDERLGEVLYRASSLSVDQLLVSAGQVGLNTKFGQVLTRSKVVDHSGLWDGLQLQVLTILKGAFGDREAMVTLSSDSASSELYIQDTGKLVNLAWEWGERIRRFGRMMASNPALKLVAQPMGDLGTYYDDFQALIQECKTYEDLVGRSKTSLNYTLEELIGEIATGVVEVADLDRLLDQLPPENEASTLGRVIDRYNAMIAKVVLNFRNSQQTFPVNNLRDFASQRQSALFPRVMLAPDGQINSFARWLILSTAVTHDFVSEISELLINLTAYARQMAADELGSDAFINP